MITGIQIRMARGYLNWSVKQLSDAAGVAVSTIKRMEQTDGTPSAYGVNIEKVQTALENAGVSFLAPGQPSPGYGVSLKD